MPSTSKKQAKFMRAVANSPKFAKKVGVPQSVGKDFEMADKKMKKFDNGGSSRPAGSPEADDVLITTPRGKKLLEEQRRREAEREKAEAEKRAKADKLLGIPSKKKGGTMKMSDKAGRAMTKKSADTMGRAMVKKAGGGKCYAKGGTASARADGIAKKGKTKGKMLAAGGLGSAVGNKVSGGMLGSAMKSGTSSGIGSAMAKKPSGGMLGKRMKKGGKC